MNTSAPLSVPGPARLVLPATSANLGPGFDAAALAMTLYLTVDAAPSETMSITATGRDAGLCGQRRQPHYRDLRERADRQRQTYYAPQN